ncbi:hypothetical protein [Nitratidesulfovibrio sp. 1201_IL3209]|uniref:hypothetical protein n=1 Tax=Nitratidesulfovibrio sp. 1201_IL3209 TaxID=3084053 RepID=UPI002FD887DA
MQGLIAAVNARHKAQLGFAAHVIEAPEGTALPYNVVSIVSEIATYNFTSTFERTIVQFDVYAVSKAAAIAGSEALKAAFDDCALTVPGYLFGKFERQFSQPLKDGDAWRVIVQYVVELQKA